MNKIRLLKFVDSTLGALLCRSLGALSAQRFPIPTVDSTRVKRILLVRPGGLGDMVMLLPVIDQLHRSFPGSNIAVLCEKRNRHILDMTGIPLQIMTYDSSPLKTLHRLFKDRYDLAIDTEQFHHFSAILSKFSGAPIRIGFNINPHRNSLYTHLINYAVSEFEGGQFMALLHPLELPGPMAYRLTGFLSGVTIESRLAPPESAGELEKAGPFVVIHPGASATFKEWPADSFSDLAAALYQQSHRAIAIVGDSSGRARAAAIAAAITRSGGEVTNLTGQLSLQDTAAVLRKARLFVGADSGLSHLACALGTPTVTIFGPSDHSKWGHTGQGHEVVRSFLPCAPCSIFGYRKNCRRVECLRQVKVSDVLAACNRAMDQSGD